MPDFDPEILQDFLTESGELLDELEGDLVVLESSPGDLELLNKAFRALHTIKGSASFLELTNLVQIAHAAETALNAARSGTLSVDREAMDLFLQAVDLVKLQMDEIRSGDELTAPDPAHVARLIQLGEGRGDEPQAPAAPGSEAAAAGGPSHDPSAGTPLVLPENKADLLEFLLVDLEDTAKSLGEGVDKLANPDTRNASAAALSELGEALGRSAEFFDHGQLAEIAKLFELMGEELHQADAPVLQQALPRVAVLRLALEAHTKTLAEQMIKDVPLGELPVRLRALAVGEPIDDGAMLGESAGAADAAAIDGCQIPGLDTPALVAQSGPAPSEAASGGPETPGPVASAPAPSEPAKPQPKQAATVEQTIRVEVARLESLMNLVGELVLQKNRINALARRLDVEGKSDPDLIEEVTESAGGLDRVTSDMQVAVMRTRMQPLDKLFGKYPRLIRDLANKTGKKIDLAIEGGETEVDKSVIEELGDPLVHLLRNAADHGLEPPEERRAAGKGDTGTIRIIASHEGSHVLVRIVDDGRGMDPERIAQKAVEKGLTTEQEVRSLSVREKLRFILEPGFSTAAQVSDLSGRGVGMDVVKTNIETLKGTLDIDSALGEGSTVSITIPLTVAIMPAMMVKVGTEAYAIPLGNVVEIVRPEQANFSSIKGRPVLNLRDSVLPMIDACDAFDLPADRRAASPFAVVLQHAGKRFALGVTAPIGQQEIVIKPLDTVVEKAGPVSGATVRDDGGVSLIVDVAALIRAGESLSQCQAGSQSPARVADRPVIAESAAA